MKLSKNVLQYGKHFFCRSIKLQVSPSSSAIEGGTIVSITGSDFGQSFEELQIVIVAGVVCEHQEFRSEYEVGSR